MSSLGTEFKLISSLIPDGCGLLEVGPGYGYTALRLRMEDRKIHITGLEICKKYYDAHQKLGIYDQMLFGDGRYIDLPSKSFDVSCAIQVIEHQPEEDADALLNNMERMTKNLVIISTPDGFHPEDGLMRDGNPASLHRSGYTERYFTDRGYETRLVERGGRLIGFLKRLGLYLKGGYGSDKVIVAWKSMSR